MFGSGSCPCNIDAVGVYPSFESCLGHGGRVRTVMRALAVGKTGALFSLCQGQDDPTSSRAWHESCRDTASELGCV